MEVMETFLGNFLVLRFSLLLHNLLFISRKDVHVYLHVDLEGQN